MFYQAYGLCEGTYDANDILQLQFSRWTYEIMDRALFEKVSLKA